jgi:hypothetical protein
MGAEIRKNLRENPSLYHLRRLLSRRRFALPPRKEGGVSPW